MASRKRYPDTTVGAISRLLDEWLSRKQWQPIELIRLLVGDDLPAVGPGEEPYVWILRGLGTGADGAEREAGLAARMGEFIDQKPEVELPGPRPEQMLFNLLSLCAAMNRPDELAAPLRRMMKRAALSGEWDGFSLKSELRAALASNQADTSMEKDWLSLARGGPHKTLEGNPFQAFDGLLLMPLPEDEDPATDSIRGALGAIVQYLEKAPNREQIFSRLIERADQTYQIGPLLDCNLLWWAFYDSWPPWARETLTLKVPDRYGLREFIRDASAEYERGPRNPAAFALKVATQAELALRSYDRQAAGALRNMRRDRLRQLGLVA